MVSIYNSAGERVRSLFDGDMAQQPVGLRVGQPAPGGSASWSYPLFLSGAGGVLQALVWNADNDNGQPVSGGTYYVKVETRDPYGTVTAFSEGVPMPGPLGGSSLAIFSPSGELVRRIPLDGLPSELVDFEVQSGRAVGSAAGASAISFSLKDASGGESPWVWDGLNSFGQPVLSGTYIVRLVRSSAGSEMVVKTDSVTLLALPGSPAERAVAGAVLAPQPFGPAASGGVLSILYPPAAGLAGRARLYNLAGELVAQGMDDGGSGRLGLSMPGLAGGIYLVEFEIRDGSALLARRSLKAAIIR